MLPKPSSDQVMPPSSDQVMPHQLRRSSNKDNEFYDIKNYKNFPMQHGYRDPQSTKKEHIMIGGCGYFRALDNTKTVEGADLAIPMDNVQQELKESLVVAIPRLNGMGHTMEKIQIDYDNKVTHVNDKSKEGFTTITRKGGKEKVKIRPTVTSRHVDGVRLSKPKPNFYFRPVQNTKTVVAKKPTENVNLADLKNSFDALRNEDNVFTDVDNIGIDKGGASTSHGINVLDSDCDEVEHVFDETGTYMEPISSSISTNSKGQALPLMLFPMYIIASWNI
nr:hypothetical protein [Tanacetum cinerariifolium]